MMSEASAETLRFFSVLMSYTMEASIVLRRVLPLSIDAVAVECLFFFFFSSRRRHTRSDRDWSSDVCSSDLVDRLVNRERVTAGTGSAHTLTIDQAINTTPTVTNTAGGKVFLTAADAITSTAVTGTITTTGSLSAVAGAGTAGGGGVGAPCRAQRGGAKSRSHRSAR